jgi:hypothetical protein
VCKICIESEYSPQGDSLWEPEIVNMHSFWLANVNEWGCNQPLAKVTVNQPRCKYQGGGGRNRGGRGGWSPPLFHQGGLSPPTFYDQHETLSLTCDGAMSHSATNNHTHHVQVNCHFIGTKIFNLQLPCAFVYVLHHVQETSHFVFLLEN